MFRIIITVIFLVAAAILIAMNVGATADINVFGWKIEQLSVAVVSIMSFVGGVLYSFIFYVLSFLERRRRERLLKRKRKLREDEAELKQREEEVDDLATKSRRMIPAPANKGTEEESGSRGAFGTAFHRLFGRAGAADEPEVSTPEPKPQTPEKRKKKK